MISVFLPKSNDCAVNETSNMLKSLGDTFNPSVIISRAPNHIDELYKEHLKVFSTAEKKLFWGHGRSDGSGIESLNGRLLNVDWWRSDMIKYELAVFHVCYGAHFFSSPQLAKKYQHWLSYSEELYMICGSPKITIVWRQIFVEMKEAILASKNSIELRNRLIEIYEGAMDRLDENSPGTLSQLVISHLEQAINSMRTN